MNPSPPDAGVPSPGTASAPDYFRRHLRFGWGLLFAYATLGVVLESLHAFKTGWYLDIGNETRRLLFTLAHAHGTLLGLVNVAFGLCARALPAYSPPRRAFSSGCLIAASLLMPLGFLLGGIWTYGGDPGRFVLIVPAASVLLVAGLAFALSMEP
jgi:hypothetical protein